MQIDRGGNFKFEITSADLSKGLRPSDKIPRNSNFLTSCVNAIGYDGTLTTLQIPTAIDTSIITDPFPYPQIFNTQRVILVFSSTKIYELVNNSLVLKLTVAAGSSWTVIDFFGYVYMSNLTVSVIRNLSGMYAISTTQPKFNAGVNNNGQCVLGGYSD